jgi:tetratricopeptide (TPR) repeat protein
MKRTSWRWVGCSLVAMASVGVVAAQAPPVPTPVPTPDPVAVTATAASGKLLKYATGEVRTTIEPLVAIKDTDARVALPWGRMLEQEKKYDEALVQLRKAAELAPANPEVRVWIGEVLMRQKKQGEADASFQKAIDLMTPKVVADVAGIDYDSRYWLGVAQQRKRLFEPAAAAFAKCLEIRPNDLMATYQLGLTRAFQGKWADAVALLTKSLDADPGIAYGYFYRALAQDKLGRKDLLVLDMQRFITLAPNAPEAERAQAVVNAAKR